MFKQLTNALLLSASLSVPFTALAQSNTATDAMIEPVISMPAGHFFENLTYKNEKELVATDYTGMSLYQYSEDGAAKLLTKVDGHPVSIRFDENGTGLLSVHETSIMQGASFLDSMALYKVTQDGQLTRLIGLDQSAFLNGMAYLGEQQYLIADAANGKIFHFDMNTSKLSIWLEDEKLQAMQERPGLPGVNGIQLYKGDLYFTNSAQQLLGKITIKDGKAGELTIVHKGIQADDFIIDEQGDWFITTHHHEVIKFTPDGKQSVLVSHGIEGNTAIQMSNKEAGVFYITNDGGLLFGGTNPAGLHKVTFK
ncbi:SMP-30/gluconolactonase/LRE family protein [Vibrio sp. D404a]|uniref:SMP-30/gluconolactonase/LRE family protein n=1 Tax=unclassified Vibrio TaxID=2614977 RepID=UPI002557A8EF|nr:MULTISPECIES: SMP-30/gluconolactonase/LRE family protein [unclassified Vibrio]MDK9739436.1 SMP-30/gluconolactonase/LRE family protein [Vibrio sp. D404a]MDK9798916.1 SMP-30/gluconolactonase/LRE family protein [Vibrio sp. D449a]